MDSGSVQKEVFFYLVPCVTVRDETEWTELVEAGWNRVAPPNGADQLAATIQQAVGSKGTAVVPYSDGRAAQKIVARLAENLAA